MGVVNTMLARTWTAGHLTIGMVDTINIVVISFSAPCRSAERRCRPVYRPGDRSVQQAAAQALTSCLLISAWRHWHCSSPPSRSDLFSDAEPQVIANGLTISALYSGPITTGSDNIGWYSAWCRDTRTPRTGSILMNLFNVFSSYVLIYGFSILSRLSPYRFLRLVCGGRDRPVDGQTPECCCSWYRFCADQKYP